MRQPPLDQWTDVLEGDAAATLFQSPIWCLAWYRCYTDFEPRVLVVVRQGALAGLVPLALERSTGRLTFAGDNMTDYRDVVVRPGFRRAVLEELLRFYKSGSFPVLHFGSTLPESPTPALLMSMAPQLGVNTHLRGNFGWRWSGDSPNGDPLKKRTIRYKLNQLRRLGTLEAAHVTDAREWESMKDDYFRQHTYRQLSAGRPVSFDSPAKRRFYDCLFRTPYGHVSTLRLDGELIAAHFGAVYEDALYFGAPSFDIRFAQYSPNMVLMALAMTNRHAWGFNDIDFTIGEGDLKERLSTSRVDLPWVELYSRPTSYLARKVRVAAIGAAKDLMENLAGPEAWEQRAKPAAEALAAKLERVRALGPREAIRRVARRMLDTAILHRRGTVYVARPDDLIPMTPRLEPGETASFHDDCWVDLGKRDRWDEPSVAEEVGAKIREFGGAQRTGRTFHTVLVNDRLAGWGASYWPTEPARLSEVGGARLEFEPDSVSLYDFYVLPEFRGRRLYQSLLTHIMRKRFAEGARVAYIAVLNNNTSSRVAIERVGFKPLTYNEVFRIAKWSRTRSRPA